MRNSYAVVWRDSPGATRTGKLELCGGSLRLDTGGKVRELPFADLTEVRIGRSAEERLAGRPALVLEMVDGPPIQVSTIGEVGALLELAERIATLQNGQAAARRLVVVVPLKPGARDTVRDLLAAGPPFDPASSELERHDVFVTDREAVFVFDAPSSAKVVERLLAKPSLWRAAARWRSHVAGPPRLAEAVYTWERASHTADR